jgi:putative redox protein
MKAMVRLVEGLQFVGETDSGKSLVFDAKEESGGRGSSFTPMELIPLALAGCTAMDVASILRKMQAKLTGLEVWVEYERTEEHPKIIKTAILIYRIYGDHINAKDIEKAIKLSEDKYCSVRAIMIPTAQISSRYEIIQVNTGEVSSNRNPPEEVK